MKWSTVTVGVMILGIIGVSIILLFQQLTTTNENDYYLLRSDNYGNNWENTPINFANLVSVTDISATTPPLQDVPAR